MLSSAFREATERRAWRCVICQLKAVYIRVMSLRRLAIREILSISLSTQGNSSRKVIGWAIKVLEWEKF